MTKYVLKRILYAIPVFLGITFVIYALINLAPGGPLSVLAASGEMSYADLEALKVSLGLDKPLLVRYFLWLWDFLHGDLGISYRTSQSVALMISQRLGPSLMLTGTGILCAILIGVPLGILSAYKPNSVWDNIGSFISFIGASVPNFFLSLLMIYVLAVKLHLFPTSGMYVYVSVKDADKNNLTAAVIKKYSSEGFEIMASEGTGIFLKDCGIDVRIIAPKEAERLIGTEINVLINVANVGNRKGTEGLSLRRKAIEKGITVLTCMDTAEVFLDVIRLKREGAELDYEPI